MTHRCPKEPPNEAHSLTIVDGCNCAIIGITDGDEKVAYSYQRLVEHFIDEFRREGASEDDIQTEAIEWVDYNIVGAAQDMVVIIYDILD